MNTKRITALIFFIFYASFSVADNDKTSATTLAIAKSFLSAAGSGDMTTLKTLMSDDFVWHNEGDKTIPWIGNWTGKDIVLNDFFPAFGAGLKVTSWTTDYSFANGNQAVFIGTMSAIANNSGVDTGKFSWAVRVHVEEGKVKSWNWFEDSYAVSKAYHTVK
ncbi:MAG: nuclear transport factor 2 family protein [Cellvibrionaceae bacterium]